MLFGRVWIGRDTLSDKLGTNPQLSYSLFPSNQSIDRELGSWNLGLTWVLWFNSLAPGSSEFLASVHQTKKHGSWSRMGKVAGNWKINPSISFPLYHHMNHIYIYMYIHTPIKQSPCIPLYHWWIADLLVLLLIFPLKSIHYIYIYHMCCSSPHFE